MDGSGTGQHTPKNDALDAFAAALGEPVHSAMDNHDLYRWIIPRYLHAGLNVLLTIRWAGRGDAVDLLISDPCRTGDDALRLMTLGGPEAVRTALDDIRGRLVCD